MNNNKFVMSFVPVGVIQGVNIPFIVFVPRGSYSGDPILMFEQDDCDTTAKAVRQVVTDMAALFNEKYTMQGPVIVPILPSEKEFKLSVSRVDPKAYIGSKCLGRGCFDANVAVTDTYYRLDKQIDRILLSLNIGSLFTCFGVGRSAITALRYTMISPSAVKKVVVGDCGSCIPILTGAAAKVLDYPFGLRDMDVLFGQMIKRNMYDHIDFEFFTNRAELAKISQDDGVTCSSDAAEHYNLLCGTPVRDRMTAVMREYIKGFLNVHMKVYPDSETISSEDFANVVYGTSAFADHPVHSLTE